ncbi:tRNA (adenosine(37)-N6)-threonylcarbamoyltransferase complex dimerization subunit type 1 TsaB [Okibacterium endophyticum]
MLLAIDTSTGTSAAVVDRDRGVLAELTSEDTMRHAEVVGAFIRDVIAQAGVRASDLSAVACGMGPGPFTGLRIGIAAARVFAFASARPLVPVVSHDAIAAAWYNGSHAGSLLVVTDARRREVYWSGYSGVDDAGIPVRSAGPALAKPDDLSGDRESAYGTRLDAHTVSAGALGMLAERMHAAGRSFQADEPVYLRSPDVTMSAGKRVTA